MSVENDEGSSIGPGPYSDEENDIDELPQGGAASIGNDSATGGASSIGNDSATGGASSIGNGSATGGMDFVDSDLSEDEDGPQTDRFGFVGGKQYTGGELGLPIEILRKRELKWLDMIDDWEKWMTKKPKKVRERCRKGIPSSLRGRAWQFLCGSKKLVEHNKDKFKELDEQPGDPKWLDVIEKDLDRQFPFHEMFAKKGGNGQQDLYRILKAYSIFNPRDGYCQGQAPVAAVLLMHMPAEEAFWCMVQICERYLTGYYSPGLEAVQVDGEVLFGLIKKVLPSTHKHMKKHRIEPILYMTEWFMCIFSRTLPWTSVLRVWDMFFCEGVKILFRVALVLLKHTLGTSQQLADSPGLYETMEKLKHIPESVMQEDFLAAEMLKVRVFEKDLEAEHSLSLARRKAIRERQLSSEKAAAMARDIEVKKKTSKTKNPAKQWEKEKKRKEKERLKQGDTDSVISMPNSVDLLDEEEEAERVRNGVEGDGTLQKDDKKKKKKDKKQKSKNKLSVDTKEAMSRNYSGELQSPDIEKEFEIVDRLSSSSASPTKSVKSRSTTGYSEKDYTSEDGVEAQGSKKKKKDKKKKSKGKETEVVAIGDDAASMIISTDGLTDTIDRKKKKDKKKKRGKSKEKGSSGEEKFDDTISIMTVPDDMMFGVGKDKKKDKKKEKKRTKSKDAEVEVDLPGMVRGQDDESVDKFSQADTASIKSFSKKDKKKEKKEKKKKGKESEKEAQAIKGNGVIRNEHASDGGNTSSPANLSEYEVVERWRPPSDSSKRGSEKRMGLIYSDDDFQNQWAGMADMGPLPEIPTYDEIRERRRSRERDEEMMRRQRLSPRSEPTTPIGENTTRDGWGGTRMPHSYSNGMEPESGLSQMNNGSKEMGRNEKPKKGPTRDYHSFDYGTTV